MHKVCVQPLDGKEFTVHVDVAHLTGFATWLDTVTITEHIR